MLIDYLADHPGFIDQLSPLLVAQWRDVIPEDTVAARSAKLQQHLNRDRLPVAWVAHDAGQVQGIAALRATDLHGREDLTPWLGGVFVADEFRGRGIGEALCRRVEHEARSLGFTTLYLFTLDKQRWYAKQGWQIHTPGDWRGMPGDIMSRVLVAPGPPDGS